MKKLYTLILILFTGLSVARSQNLVQDVTNNYPLSIISKVQDVVIAANISSSEQILLANLFLAEEKAINIASNNNDTGQQLQAIEINVIQQFRSILSAPELALYSENRKKSRFSLLVDTQK